MGSLYPGGSGGVRVRKWAKGSLPGTEPSVRQVYFMLTQGEGALLANLYRTQAFSVLVADSSLGEPVPSQADVGADSFPNPHLR